MADRIKNCQKTKNGLPRSDYLRESKMDLDGFASEPQELYLSENPKLGLTPKGKEVIMLENSQQDEKLVERDFINQIETKANSSSKREVHEEDEIERENCSREKKLKLQSGLNFSLAVPDKSLSLQKADLVIKPSARTSNNDTQTSSNHFTAALHSYSHYQPFYRNPSYSLLRNSTENYECSVVGYGNNCGGEGANGFVRNKFRPVGYELVAPNNNNDGGGGNEGFPMTVVHRGTNKSSLYMSNSSDNISFFPTKLPASRSLDAHSDDSSRMDLENLRDLEDLEAGGKALKLYQSLLRVIVSEPVSVITRIIRESAQETLVSTKAYLLNLIDKPERRDELVGLQDQLRKRFDLTKGALSMCQKYPLDILVAVKMGLSNFVSEEVWVPANELVEIFLYMRCRNVGCRMLLPVDDCGCKFCSANEGFCSACMCLACMDFDYVSNTCSWVACDFCSHWCHAACGAQNSIFRPGPSIKGPKGTTEIKFYCMACNHGSEMFGFVKDVFVVSAKDWGLETLIKELNCVRNIFKGSKDYKGKALLVQAEELLSKLESKTMYSSYACNIIIQFFDSFDGVTEKPLDQHVKAWNHISSIGCTMQEFPYQSGKEVGQCAEGANTEELVRSLSLISKPNH